MVDKKIVVYTCVTGGKDSPRNQPYEEGVRYVCFTDKAFDSNFWEVITIPLHRSTRRTARKVKVLSQEMFPNADYTIWIDANMQMLKKPSYYVSKYLVDGVFVASRPHPSWSCVYKEALVIQQLAYENNDILIPWVKKLADEEYPVNNGLAETGFLIRDNSLNLLLFNSLWWDCIEDYSQRDQLSFDYCHWLLDTKYSLIDREEVLWFPHLIPTSVNK